MNQAIMVGRVGLVRAYEGRTRFSINTQAYRDNEPVWVWCVLWDPLARRLTISKGDRLAVRGSVTTSQGAKGRFVEVKVHDVEVLARSDK